MRGGKGRALLPTDSLAGRMQIIGIFGGFIADPPSETSNRLVSARETCILLLFTDRRSDSERAGEG
jgi:hypothetical protein